MHWVGGCVERPHRTQSRLAEAYLHTKWHLSPFSHFATKGRWPKIGVCAPLGEGNWVPI